MRVCDYGPGEARDGRSPGHPVFGVMQRKKYVYRHFWLLESGVGWVLELSGSFEGHGEKNITLLFLFFPSLHLFVYSTAASRCSSSGC